VAAYEHLWAGILGYRLPNTESSRTDS